MERHYGMDWLRIGAFALLIVYHVGMVFVPWGYHVKTEHPLVWAEIPMFLTNPWRLTLLFVVSGYASRALIAKTSGMRTFLSRRSGRLLWPLLFGMAVVVPPQTWVELTTQHGYAASYLHFWATDYFRFGTLADIVMPTWNHLWFLPYLWVYTALLAGAAMLPPGMRAQAWFDRAFGGWRALAVPALYLVLLESVIFNRPDDTHDLIHDGVAHLRYLPAFLFGFGLAGSRSVMAALAQRWKAAAAIAVGCYAVIAGLLIAYPDFSFTSEASAWAYRLARHGEAWPAIAALIGIADRYWNRESPWRPMLTEAVFPFYIIHQTVIVLVDYWIIGRGIAPAAQFAILLPATVAGCWAFYLSGREIGWLRPLIGLKNRATARRPFRNARLDGLDQPATELEGSRTP